MYANMIHMVLHMMSYIYSHCRTEGRWLTGVNLQVRTSTLAPLWIKVIFFSDSPTCVKLGKDPDLSGIKIEIRIQIGINTMPIHDNAFWICYINIAGEGFAWRSRSSSAANTERVAVFPAPGGPRPNILCLIDVGYLAWQKYHLVNWICPGSTWPYLTISILFVC